MRLRCAGVAPRRPRAPRGAAARSPSPRRSASRTALAVVSAAVTAVTAESTLDAAVAALPPGERSVVVSTYGLPTPQRVARARRAGPPRAARLGAGPVRRQLLYREIGDTHRNTVVARRAPTTWPAPSGWSPGGCPPPARPPGARSCSPCPTGRPGGRDAAAPDPRPCTRRRRRRLRAAHRPAAARRAPSPRPGAPLLLGDGVARGGRARGADTVRAHVGWVTPLDLARVKALGVDAWADAADRRSPTSSPAPPRRAHA